MTKLTIRDSDGNTLKTLDISPEKTLLHELQKAEIDIPNACRAGMCGACMCHIESGAEHVQKNKRGEPSFPLADDEVMTCIGGVTDSWDEIVLKTLY